MKINKKILLRNFNRLYNDKHYRWTREEIEKDFRDLLLRAGIVFIEIVVEIFDNGVVRVNYL